MRILFCIVIAIPKGMSGKYFLKVSSISDIAIMSKLQIKTLKFVYSSCCFTIPELVLSDQLIAGTHNFRTNFFRPTKFRTNKFPDQLFFRIFDDFNGKIVVRQSVFHCRYEWFRNWMRMVLYETVITTKRTSQM